MRVEAGDDGEELVAADARDEQVPGRHLEGGRELGIDDAVHGDGNAAGVLRDHEQDRVRLRRPRFEERGNLHDAREAELARQPLAAAGKSRGKSEKSRFLQIVGVWSAAKFAFTAIQR